VDREVGGRLGTREQWADLKGQVQALVTLPRTGPPAVTAVAPVLELELAHVATVRDGALLALDPELDSTHLLDAVAVSIPGVLVDAARVGDLRALGGARGRTPSLQVAVAQAGLSARAATLDASLRRGLSATSSTDLAPAMIAQLDVLRVAVNAMAPPVAEVGAAPVVPAADQLRAAQTQVRDAALEVASSSLDQLDDLLRERSAGIERERRLVVLVTVAAVLLLALAAWFGTGGRPRHRPDDAEDGSRDGSEDGTGYGARDGDDRPAAAVDPEDELRLLADLHEPPEPPPGRALARVGRAVAPPRDGR
jgi:hypothetical protein